MATDKEYNKKWRAANKDKIAAANKRWRDKNPTYMIEWRKNNPDKIKKYSRTYYVNHTEEIAERNRKYRENPDNKANHRKAVKKYRIRNRKEINIKEAARARWRWANDPEWKARRQAAQSKWYEKNKDKQIEKVIAYNKSKQAERNLEAVNQRIAGG